MIGSTSSGASFGALGSYLERGKGGGPDGAPSPDRVAWVESRGVVQNVDGSTDVERAGRVMEATADLNPRCTEPCYHVSISFDAADLPGGPTDPASREVMLGVARDTLRDLGLGEHQVVVVAHGDRDHPHMHLMVNRVHPETGRAWDRWQDRVKLERSLRGQERARGLREVPGHLGRLEGQERPARGLSRGAHRAAEREALRTGERPPLEQARADVRWEFKGAKSWDDLEGRLAVEGYVLRAKGRGLVVRDGAGREVKASAVAREGGRGQLERRFGEGWREHRARVETRTGPVPEGLSPHGEAALRTHREAETVRELTARLRETQELTGAAHEALWKHEGMEGDVRSWAASFRRRLAEAYRDPAGAERLFLRLVGKEGDRRAVGELAARPERFGALREAEHRTLGIVTKRTVDEAQAAAGRAAETGAGYLRAWRALGEARERDPRELREAKAAHARALAPLEGRPSGRELGERLGALGRGVTGADRAVLGRSAPGVGRAVEKAVARALKVDLERGYDLGR